MNLFDKKYELQELVREIYYLKYKYEYENNKEANVVVLKSEQVERLRDLYITRGQMEMMFGMEIIIDNEIDSVKVYHKKI